MKASLLNICFEGKNVTIVGNNASVDVTLMGKGTTTLLTTGFIVIAARALSYP